MKFTQLSLTIAALCVAAGAAHAAGAAGPTPKLAIVYDAGGKFDKSFNQSASEGVSRFKKETGINVLEAQANYDTQAEQVLRALARKKMDLIVSIGFSQTQPVQKIAAEYPHIHFVIVDGDAQGKNVNSVLFKEHEGSYLVGVAAAMASKTKVLGFVGGMDIPLIRAFACGYAQGAKAVTAANWRARSSTAAPTWCSRWPAAPAWAPCRWPRKKASWRSASTPTRTTCTRARC
jgi:basic membrane protein A